MQKWLAVYLYFQNIQCIEKKIDIPSSITQMGRYAFHQCKALNEILIPSSVEQIGEFAFSECESLNSISIPASINEIERLDLCSKTKIIRT